VLRNQFDRLVKAVTLFKDVGNSAGSINPPEFKTQHEQPPKTMFNRIRNSSSSLHLPRILTGSVEKPAMLRIPFTVQNLDDRRRPFTRRLRAHLRFVARSQVRHRKSRAICKHLEPQRTVLDRLARCDHVQRGLARTVRLGFHIIPDACRI
jgi:hypothetical protein